MYIFMNYVSFIQCDNELMSLFLHQTPQNQGKNICQPLNRIWQKLINQVFGMTHHQDLTLKKTETQFSNHEALEQFYFYLFRYLFCSDWCFFSGGSFLSLQAGQMPRSDLH